jgi:Kef-type K+ transport system membrane component KefB
MPAYSEEFLLHVLVQLVVIIAAARAGAWLFGKLGQPQVVGEIAAGLMLGPSLLGRLSPETLAYVFAPEYDVVFKVVSELGLVFLMFLIGLEFDFSHLRHVGRTAGSIALAGIAVPFALGAAVAYPIHAHVAPGINPVAFVLFVATALSITAIPILGRIMVEFNLQRTRLGALTITAAAVDDALGWILLAGVSALVSGALQLSAIAAMLATTALFVGSTIFLAPRLLGPWLHRSVVGNQGNLTVVAFSVVLVLVLGSAIATNRIGIYSIFGPFVLGAALSADPEFREAVVRRLRDFVYVFFLPIFFTYTGLRTDVGLLDTGELWLICGLLLAAAVVGKVGGCGLAARLGGLSWRESGCVAVMMNTRALMGLIAINIGRNMGAVPDSVFSMLVLMALVTTFATTPLLRLLLPDDHRTEGNRGGPSESVRAGVRAAN